MFVVPQEIVEAVHQETELVFQGTTSVHEGLGMFVLVMMSHGDTGTILGCDDKHVNLVDIYKLLSSQNFPAMRGKPKLIILQACSGGLIVHAFLFSHVVKLTHFCDKLQQLS